MSRSCEIVSLPPPEKRAYFPRISSSKVLEEEALRRTGGNLVYAIAYGSHITGDASPTSRFDMILIVKDTKLFHKQNMQDHGHPHSVKWHSYLNTKGFNFYQGVAGVNDWKFWIKYGVISAEDFIRGCKGVLKENEEQRTGAFGLYIAGRVQKVALCPLFKGNEQQVVQIEQAINTARIDGVWLSLGLLKDEFSFDDLLTNYVSLSYKADLRIEKPNKVRTLVEKGWEDYQKMLTPILNSFESYGLIRRTKEGKWMKIKSLDKKEAETRLKRLKVRTAITNYGRAPLAFGFIKGAGYAMEKFSRVRQEKASLGDVLAGFSE